MLLFQKRQAPVRIGFDHLVAVLSAQVRLNVEKGVERAGHLNAGHAVNCRDAGSNVIASFGEFRKHCRNAGLVALNCRQRRELADRTRVGRLLTLQSRHRLGDVGRRKRPADSPAGHGVRLADPVNQNRFVLQARSNSGEGREFVVPVNEVLVDLVCNNDDVFFQNDVRQLTELFRRVHASRRVGRRAQQQRFCFGRNRRAQQFRRKPELIFLTSLDDYRDAAGEFNQFRIGNPVRSGNDNLVARIDGNGKRVVQSVLGAVGNDDVGRLVFQTVFCLVRRGNRLAQRHNARRGRVSGFARLNRLESRLTDMFRRVEVRLSQREIVNSYASRFHFFGFAGHSQRRRRL